MAEFNRARSFGRLRPSLGDASTLSLERQIAPALFRSDFDESGELRGVRVRDARARMLAGAAIAVGLGDLAFTWNPEIAEEVPASGTYSRNSVVDVLTTENDVTFYSQPVKSNELRLEGMRKGRNFARTTQYDDFTAWQQIGSVGSTADTVTFNASNDGTYGSTVADANLLSNLTSRTFWFLLAATGDGTVTLRIGDGIGGDSVAQVITLTATPTIFAVKSNFTTTARTDIQLRIRKEAGNTATTLTRTSEGIYILEGEDGASAPPTLDINPNTTYNANVVTSRYYATINSSTIDGNGEATSSTGAAIAGGGYLSEPAAIATVDDVLLATPIPEQFTVFADVTVPDPLPAGDVIVAVGSDDAGNDGFIRVNGTTGAITAFDGVTTITSSVTATAGLRFKAAFWASASKIYLSVNAEATVSDVLGASAFVGDDFFIGGSTGGDHWNTAASPTSNGLIHLVQIYDGNPSAADLAAFFF